MFCFWDTSAIIAVLFQEPHSTAAQQAVAQTIQGYAWRWLQVEAHAAMIRRKSRPSDLLDLKKLLSSIHWIDIPAEQYDDLCKFNEKHRLRSADAAHLFCFKQASIVLPELILICFDDEIIRAAKNEKLRIWTPSGRITPNS